MRKVSILLLLFLATMLCSSRATAQTTPGFIPATSAPVVTDTTEQAFARLAHEVESGRAEIAAAHAENKALEAALTAEQANSASLSKSYAEAQREITTLQTANGALERAVALNEKTIALLTTAKQDADRRAKKANKRAIVATAAAAGALLLKFGLL